MGLDDIINNTSPKTKADAEELTMGEYDWKYIFAHQPWIADRLANLGSDAERELVIEWLEDLIVDGHPEMEMNTRMRDDIRQKLSEIQSNSYKASEEEDSGGRW